ncbi:MAG: putative toxin-antitoxin system toxin component, PIN family [Caldilineaceae bacterium]|nr:putative toxin-antitoxin system toxin component, PIN family [Caldilineaceae bacterium]
MAIIPSVVIDTNILVTALRSNRGASYKLVSLIGTGLFEVNLSVPLFVEYEAILVRECPNFSAITPQDIYKLLNFVAGVSIKREIYYLWRPFLRDPNDDLVLEVAVNAGCQRIITYNLRDFRGCERFGIQPITAREFLQELGVLQ